MKNQNSGQGRYSRLSAACEPFRKAKTETIHTFAGIGRKHTILRYPIMALVFIYNVIIYGGRQLKVREKFSRGLALVMTAILVFNSVNIALFTAAAENTDDRKLKNGSFEEGQTWSGSFKQLDQSAVPSWNTTASDGKIELFQENKGVYIDGTLKPTHKRSEDDKGIAAELNADEESTLYQNVKTMPFSIYQWGLDHGARNGTDTMALVIGPKQEFNPSKPSKSGRDQLMQMVDWLIGQNKTSIKTSSGLGEQLVVYSKKFDEKGTFQDNTGNNAFSLTPSSIYTEEWHIWIIADKKEISQDEDKVLIWGSYGSNAEGTAGSSNGSGGTSVDMSKYYLYTVPAEQTETLFGFVSVGFDQPATSADKAKTFGNFLDNINFEIYHPLSGSTTNHGSGVVGGSDGTTEGEGSSSTGYEVTVDKNLITYAVDGEPLKVQAVVKSDDESAGCEFIGLYYTKQDEAGNQKTVFLQLVGNEIEDTGSLTEADKKDKWIKSTNSAGDTIHTYYLDNITSATDLHFVFIKSPTVTYDPNGGKAYTVDRIYNTTEKDNVYSFKPNLEPFTYISPYVSHAAVGQNDGWKFMGWLLTGDTVDSENIPEGTSLINADKLGKLLLPAEHTIACDYAVGGEAKEQYFKIWEGNVPLTGNTGNPSCVKWETDQTATYANVHKGLTMVAQWRWRQAFIPQLKSGDTYGNSAVGGTVEITSVTNTSDANYNGAYNGNGGKSYFAETNEIVTAKATANQNFTFEGWYDENGNLLTTNETYSFTETKDNVNTYYARFSGSVTQNFKCQVKNDEGNWVDTTEESIATLDRDTYTDVAGKLISATATAGTNYKLVGWYDEDGDPVTADMLSNDGKTLSYTTTGDATYYARFEIKVNQTFIRQVKDGDTWKNTENDAIATLEPYKHSDVVGETASCTATPGTGYKFEGWYDEYENKVTDGRTLSYQTTGDATYYARFSRIFVTQTFVRQVNDSGVWEDTIDNSIATLDCYTHYDGVGETASSTAAPEDDYVFVGWYDENENPVAADMLINDGKTLSYTTTGNATYYARFSKKVTQTFKRQVNNCGTWEDTEDDDIATLNPSTHYDGVGETASCTATAGTDYKFEGWYDEDGNKVTDTDMLSDDGRTLSYTTTGDATYYARFSRIIVTQTFIRQVMAGSTWEDTTNNSIATLSSYTHSGGAGETASCTATAGTGYKFEGWYDADGNQVADSMLSDNGRTISYTTTGDATYYARFSRIIVTQTFVRQVKDGDTWKNTTDNSIATLDRYTYYSVIGKYVSVTATAGTGYEFEGWYDAYGNKVADNKLSNDGKTLSYTTTGYARYYARFSKVIVTTTVTESTTSAATTTTTVLVTSTAESATVPTTEPVTTTTIPVTSTTELTTVTTTVPVTTTTVPVTSTTELTTVTTTVPVTTTTIPVTSTTETTTVTTTVPVTTTTIPVTSTTKLTTVTTTVPVTTTTVLITSTTEITTVTTTVPVTTTTVPVTSTTETTTVTTTVPVTTTTIPVTSTTETTTVTTTVPVTTTTIPVTSTTETTTVTTTVPVTTTTIPVTSTTELTTVTTTVPVTTTTVPVTSTTETTTVTTTVPVTTTTIPVTSTTELTTVTTIVPVTTTTVPVTSTTEITTVTTTVPVTTTTIPVTSTTELTTVTTTVPVTTTTVPVTSTTELTTVITTVPVTTTTIPVTSTTEITTVTTTVPVTTTTVPVTSTTETTTVTTTVPVTTTTIPVTSTTEITTVTTTVPVTTTTVPVTSTTETTTVTTTVPVTTTTVPVTSTTELTTVTTTVPVTTTTIPVTSTTKSTTVTTTVPVTTTTVPVTSTTETTTVTTTTVSVTSTTESTMVTTTVNPTAVLNNNRTRTVTETETSYESEAAKNSSTTIVSGSNTGISEGGNHIGSPKTGDSDISIFWFILMATGVLGSAAFIMKPKKR